MKLTSLLALFIASTSTYVTTAAELDITTATIPELQEAMDSGALTAEKLLTLYLKRIETYNYAGPNINSIITLNPNAMEVAKALDRERAEKGPRGPLHGIPVVFKDLFDTADLPTSGGFLPLKDARPEFDATVVKRVRDAGGIVLAKTNMSDWFGVAKPGDQSTVLGRTSNPYNLDITPGGSSGGTGAALGAAFAQVGFGSETGVSIRNPTANNSLVALAPTRGLIPRTGMIMTAFLQERAGPMGRSVTDVAILSQAVAGFDVEDLLSAASLDFAHPKPYVDYLDKDALRGMRIGVFRDLFRSGPRHEEGIAMIEAAIEQMKAGGATIIDPVTTNMELLAIDRELRTNFWEGPYSYDLYFRRVGANTPIKNMDDLIRVGGDLVKPKIILAYQEKDLHHNPEYLARRRTQASVKEAILKAMDYYDVDVLVHPFKTLPPEGHGVRITEKDNPISSITGLPAVLVPAGYTKDVNGPISIEFLGRPFSEPTLFQAAYGYEQISKVRKTPELTPARKGEKISY
jgi:amidase